MERDFWTDQRGDRVEDFGSEGKGANERAIEISRTQLQVLFGGGSRFAITSRGHIAEKIVSLESRDVGLERGGFLSVEKPGHGEIALASERLDLI